MGLENLKVTVALLPDRLFRKEPTPKGSVLFDDRVSGPQSVEVPPSKGAPFPKEKSFMGPGGLAWLGGAGVGADDTEGLGPETSGGSWVGVACCAAHPAMTITHIVDIVWIELGMMCRRVTWRARENALAHDIGETPPE